MKKNFLRMSAIVVLMVLALGMKTNAQTDLTLLSESFDATTFPPTGWLNVIGSGTYSWARVTSGTFPTCTPHSGAGMAWFDCWDASSGYYASLITPVLDFTGNTGTFGVTYWHFHDPTYSGDKVDVYVNTTASLSGATMIGTVLQNAGTGWISHTFTIPAAFNTATNYVIFKGTSAYGNGMHIDDITINKPTPTVPDYYNNNAGTSNNSFPFNMAAGKAVNWLFAANSFIQPSPVPTGKKIDVVYFRIGTAGTRTFTTLQILMAQSAITGLTSGAFYAGPWDTVYNHASAALTGTLNGWMAVELDHSFNYDPNQSLIIFVGQCAATGSGLTVWQTVLGGTNRVWSVGGCPFTPYAGGDGSTVDFGLVVSNSGVGINEKNPQSFELSQNYPNPFSQSTMISYQLTTKTDVVLKVYDLMGKEVSTLVNANQIAGKYEVNFDASNLAAGMYVYQLTTNNFSQTKRMLIQK